MLLGKTSLLYASFSRVRDWEKGRGRERKRERERERERERVNYSDFTILRRQTRGRVQ